MTLKVSTATGTAQAVARLPEQNVFIVRNICKTCVRYFFCLFTLQLFISPGEVTSDHVHGTVAIYIAWRNGHVRCLLYWRSLHICKNCLMYFIKRVKTCFLCILFFMYFIFCHVFFYFLKFFVLFNVMLFCFFLKSLE